MAGPRDLSLWMRLYADASNFVRGVATGERAVKGFSATARREFDAVRNTLGGIKGQLAGLGVGVGGVALLAQSARMDKSLNQIGQTAGVAGSEVVNLRKELFSMAAETGQSVEALQQGFNNAVQSGLNFGESLPVIKATNVAIAVTGAAADRLTASLTVAGTAFHFDLSKPGLALELLDKMTVAGRLGNAELENLSDIFARVGVNAASAGLGFNQTLGFIEGLSMVERQPERLATLADSTLRLFTNLNYMKEAAQGTHVRFFETDGSRRDPLAVLKDMKAQYDKLGSDKARAVWMQQSFGKADLDTIKGLRTLFNGDMLTKVGEFSKEIGDAGGTLKRDLPDALSNAVDQTGRLKSELRKAADDFTQPINNTIQQLIKWGLDKKENGGLGLDGKGMILGGGALALGTLGAARYGGKAVEGLLKRFGGTAAGLAEGKALEAAAGVTPVFVVNWPGGGFPGLPGAGGAAGGAAEEAVRRGKWLAPGAISSMAFATAPLAAMWGVKSWAEDTSQDQSRVQGIRDSVGSPAERLLSWLGLDFKGRFDSQTARNREGLDTTAEVKGQIDIKVGPTGEVASVRATSRTQGVNLNVDAGPLVL
ncbi:hypothetical protein DLREEDagrD3_29020 [Denitratisoma sp. agr-D3]